MRRPLLLTLVAALAVPALAAAKGPSQASVSGPGVSIDVRGDGEGGSATGLGRLVENAGFFPAVYARSPDPMLASRPAGDLGPKYTVTYVLPGPNGVASRIVQDLYPYATPHAVTYTEPGQPFWGGERTHGGWYVSPGGLTTGIGLPATPPGGDGTPLWRWLALAAAAAAAALAALLALRRLPRTRPATT